ncbi:hypothetical protein [Paeniglutamicibacter psychrophenolicus]|uniref:hypothetical protein n=1 Tax=Paeniglutamicibacter psychrophenolicus TaxID=257454 RepID=UPI00278B5F52|nr:hypothetical protein [Paeniglutamicibacter psychrophenolicus]MDQ0093277.1 hypothetical protein [Paeniglutamicibacter psychrophenolicus]
MATTSGNDAWIENWLSVDRFSTYLEAAGGSRKRALDLYEWNAKLSAAFLHDLSHLEVGLRNACDRQLAAAIRPGDTHWTDPNTLLALFGFWTYLLSDSHEKTIWVPYLHKAFPLGTDRNQLNDSLASLRAFRNRVAHHENILKGSEGERRRIVYLVRLLSTDALEHLQSNSDVATILAKRP